MFTAVRARTSQPMNNNKAGLNFGTTIVSLLMNGGMHDWHEAENSHIPALDACIHH